MIGHTKFAARTPPQREMCMKIVVLLFFCLCCGGLKASVGTWPLPKSGSRTITTEKHTAQTEAERLALLPLPTINDAERQRLKMLASRIRVPYLLPWGGDEAPSMFALWRFVYRSLRSDLNYRYTPAHARKCGGTQQGRCDASPRSSAPLVGEYHFIPIHIVETQDGFITASVAAFFPELFVFSVLMDANRVAHQPTAAINASILREKKVGALVDHKLAAFVEGGGTAPENLLLCATSAVLNLTYYINMMEAGLGSDYELMMFPYAVLQHVGTDVKLFEDAVALVLASARVATFVALPRLQDEFVDDNPSYFLEKARQHAEMGAFLRWYGSSATTPREALEHIMKVHGLNGTISSLGKSRWGGLSRELFRIDVQNIHHPPHTREEEDVAGNVHRRQVASLLRTTERPRRGFGCEQRRSILQCIPRSLRMMCPYRNQTTHANTTKEVG